MRALLLAAGYGTRLRPLTNTMPKCLVPIRKAPLLDIWLAQLTQANLGPFLINTHYLAEQVEEHIQRSPYRDSVTIRFEPDLLGTAGTLRQNLDFFGDQDGLLIHADNYCSIDFEAFIAAHRSRPSGCLLTMLIFEAPEPSSCGIVELDERGVLIDFHEKVPNPPSNLANGAVYIFDKRFMDYLRVTDASDFSLKVIPMLLNRIATYKTEGVFMDIGTPESYQAAQSIEF